MPPPPSLNRSRPAFRVTGATPSGRPGPRATNSHKRQAGAAPFRKDRWAAWRVPSWPSRATQASAPLKPRRAELAAGAPASRPAGQPPTGARRRFVAVAHGRGRARAVPRSRSSCTASDGTRACAPEPRAPLRPGGRGPQAEPPASRQSLVSASSNACPTSSGEHPAGNVVAFSFSPRKPPESGRDGTIRSIPSSRST
jgi:hypothetical protein